jgi:hypothetical protein
MSWDYESELVNQRIDDLRREAGRARVAQEARRARRRGRRLRPLGLARLIAVARSATETLGLILSPAWPVQPGTPGNVARPSLGR